MNLPIDHLTADASTTNMCLEFSSGETIAFDTKGIGHKHSPSRDSSDSHFPPPFYSAFDFLASGIVPDDTLHLSHKHPLFGTRAA